MFVNEHQLFSISTISFPLFEAFENNIYKGYGCNYGQKNYMELEKITLARRID
jgi:hypothetical protein